MSCFRGKLKEYPSLSLDCFDKENLQSSAYFLSHCHKDHMEGLDSAAFAKRIQSSDQVFIYCSETTRNLLLWNPIYAHLKDYLIGIPVEQPYMVSLHGEEKESEDKEEAVSVTLLSAGHCVGSVMFLIEGNKGNVLYTGDFRLAKGDTSRIGLLHCNGRVKDIASVYVDTTFCLTKMMSIPSRKQTNDAIIRVIDRWFSRGPDHIVSLECKGMYGYEYLLKEIALHYKTKIHISPERLELYHNLKDMTPHFTTDPKASRIHSCHWKTSKSIRSILPCKYVLSSVVAPKVLRIKPSTMWFARRPHPLPTDHTKYDKDKKIWRVVHSMHASMEEIRDLVGYLRPYHVYANVEPGGLYTTDDACNWLKDLTRDGAQEDSGRDSFSAMATEFQISDIQRKAIVRSAPSESVMSTCKELGLEDDVISAPLPPKRRKKLRSNFVAENTKQDRRMVPPSLSCESVVAPEDRSEGPRKDNVTDPEDMNQDDIVPPSTSCESVVAPEDRSGGLRKDVADPKDINKDDMVPPGTSCESVVAPEDVSSPKNPRQEAAVRFEGVTLEITEGRKKENPSIKVQVEIPDPKGVAPGVGKVFKDDSIGGKVDSVGPQAILLRAEEGESSSSEAVDGDNKSALHNISLHSRSQDLVFETLESGHDLNIEEFAKTENNIKGEIRNNRSINMKDAEKERRTENTASLQTNSDTSRDGSECQREGLTNCRYGSNRSKSNQYSQEFVLRSVEPGHEPFDIPASPGIIRPSKDVLSALYKRLESGETIAGRSLSFN